MKTEFKKNNLWIVSWVICLAGVGIASVIPFFSPPQQFDKILHFGCYFFLTAIPLACFIRREVAFLSAGCMPPLGLALEYIQNGINGRNFSPEDMIANNLGAAAGIGVGILFRLLRKENRIKRQKDA
jgi:VanZ family protein